MPVFGSLGARFLLAGLLLALLGRLAGIPSARHPHLHRVWFLETLFGLLVSYGVAYWSQQTIPSGLASLLFATFPLFVALLAHRALPSEPLRARELAGILAAVLGVATLFSDDLALPGAEARGAAVVFLAAPLGAAVSHVWIKKWGSGIHPLRIVTMPMVLTGAALVLGSLAWEDGGWAIDGRTLFAFAYLTIPGSVVTFTVYYWLLERVPATKLSLITLGFPVVAVGFGAILLGETVTGQTVGGSLLVLSGVALAATARRVGPPPSGEAAPGA